MKKSEVMALLRENKDERGIANWKKNTKFAKSLKSYGIGLTKLRKMAKEIGKNHKLALSLWNSDYHEAKILGLLIDDPKLITREQVEEQVENLKGGYLCHVFSSCDATLAKTPFVVDLACEWMGSKDKIRRSCAWGLIYEIAKFKGKKAPDQAFFLDCIARIQESMIPSENMWVKESMNGALLGIGKRDKKLNTAAIKAVKAIGPVHIDYGDDNSCEPLDVIKHLTSDYMKKKFAKQAASK